MKVIKQGNDSGYKDFYTDKYEFRLCGGSVEPKDKKASKGTKKSK